MRDMARARALPRPQTLLKDLRRLRLSAVATENSAHGSGMAEKAGRNRFDAGRGPLRATQAG